MSTRVATDLVEVFLIIAVVALVGGIFLGVAIEAWRRWSTQNQKAFGHLAVLQGHWQMGDEKNENENDDKCKFEARVPAFGLQKSAGTKLASMRADF
jgi:hypothetical protein